MPKTKAPQGDLIFLSHLYESRAFLNGDVPELVGLALSLRPDPEEALAMGAAILMREFERLTAEKYGG